MMKKMMVIVMLLPLLWGCSANDNNTQNTALGSSDMRQLDMKQLQDKLETKDSFLLMVTQSTCSYCNNLKNTMKPFMEENPELPLYELEIDMLGTKKSDMNENLQLLKQVVTDYGGSTPEIFYYKQGKLNQKANGDMSEVAFRNFLIDCGLITGEKKADDETNIELKMNKQMKEIDFLNLSKLITENQEFYVYIAENDRYNEMLSKSLAAVIEGKEIEIQVLNLSTQPQLKMEAEYQAVTKSMQEVQKVLYSYQYSPSIFHVKDGKVVDHIVDNVSKKELQKWFDKQ